MQPFVRCMTIEACFLGVSSNLKLLHQVVLPLRGIRL
ncbi:hypothetical protein DDN44_12030 [Vibrio cholerae]|nr:hypothetical protein [Vibrio cholerae]EGR4157615.1 hypothetical protein [Vibrio cholerae]EGR4287063.1 hypothetical protein [Vibrio cholerae]MEB5540755.1 hypothetical protein [Vibrio cholerae]MEB5548565.1 hypothetical protein [Vibrio cholerae]